MFCIYIVLCIILKLVGYKCQLIYKTKYDLSLGHLLIYFYLEETYLTLLMLHGVCYVK